MTAVAAALLGAFLKWLSGLIFQAKDRSDTINGAKSEGAAEAGNETQDVIAGIADDRSKLSPMPTDAPSLSSRLRADAAAARRGSAGG